MKGIVFTEFMEMVEVGHGYDMVDKIITDVNPESGGAYTAIGTYPHSEMVSLIVSLSKQTNVSVPDLLHTFGRYLFDTFVKNYPSFLKSLKRHSTFLTLLKSIYMSRSSNYIPMLNSQAFTQN